MKSHTHIPLITRYVVRPLPPSAKAHREKTNFVANPLSAVIRCFHRLATLLLIVLMGSEVVVWLTMRLLYPQPDDHIDDLSSYDAFMPGKIINPADLPLEFLPHQAQPEEMNLDRTHANSYMLTAKQHIEVVIIDIPYQQSKISRFILYPSSLRLDDLMWRWGRPDYKQKDTENHFWVIKWFKGNFSAAIACRKLKLNETVILITLTLN